MGRRTGHFGGIVSQPCIAAGPASGEAAASRQTPRLRSAGALLAQLLGFLLIVGLLVGVPVDHATADTAPADPNDPSTPVTVSDDALPAPQINGVVWSQAMIGNFVYVGGSFSNARPAGSPAGQNTVARSNFLAFNVTTGQLMTNVTPSFNAQIRSVFASPDKTKLYVAGEFTTVNGQTRRRVAEFTVNGNTGALTLTSFAPSVNSDVEAVVATNSKVFVGGSFLGVGNQDRQYLAAFNAGTGALVDWAPQATGGTVWALTINPQGTKVVAGGSFTAMNGSSNPGYGLAMLDTGTADGRDANGDPLTFEVNDEVRNGTADGAITTPEHRWHLYLRRRVHLRPQRWHLGGHFLGQLGRGQDQLSERLPWRHLLSAAGGTGCLLGGPHPLLREHRRPASGRRRCRRLPLLPGDRHHPRGHRDRYLRA